MTVPTATDLTRDQQRTLGRIEGMLEASGLSPHLLEGLLATAAEGDLTDATDRADVTIGDLVDDATRALDPGTVRTYGTYWRILRYGLRIPAHWEGQRVREWARDADAASRDKGFGLSIDLTGASYQRYGDEHGEWIEVVPGYDTRRPRELRQSEVRVLAKWVRVNALAALARRNRTRAARGLPALQGHGKGAVENYIAATRCLFTFAAGDGLVPAGHNPAAPLRKPNREPTRLRRSMTDDELRDVWMTSITTGDDPELDEMLYEFHADTGARQEGAINLKLKHLVRDGVVGKRQYRNVITLDQKGDKRTVVPVRGSLIDRLETFAASRGSVHPEDPVFRYRGQHPTTGETNWALSSRRYDTWHERVRDQHAWAREVEWSAYWFRHHAAEQIEALAGRDAKRLFLGHETDGVTDEYGPSDHVHVAWAVSMLNREPHPDAQPPRRFVAPHRR